MRYRVVYNGRRYFPERKVWYGWADVPNQIGGFRFQPVCYGRKTEAEAIEDCKRHAAGYRPTPVVWEGEL